LLFTPIAKQKIPVLDSDYKNLILKMLQKKYPYLLLGLTVLLVVYLLFSGFLSKSNLSLLPLKANNEKVEQEGKNKATEEKKYVVKAGDDLWHIAESFYGSGYSAYDIARANNLSNPSLIEVGQKLLLPSLTPQQPTIGEVAVGKTEQVTISGAQYTVQPGDYLWEIALKAYGDGYAWTRIAQANKLADPNLIFSGNVLIIPR
jgi:nucleoid-associated protein YgaU